jgi:hypothetical protein
MNNYYKYNIHNSITLPPLLGAKAIILDSLTPYDSSKIEKDIISSFISTNIEAYNKNKSGIFYNYIIDRLGDIHEIIPIPISAKCCQFSEYSEEASILFPEFCSFNKKSSITPDQEVISIATISNDCDTNNYYLDSGIMTSECHKSLFNLIIYLLCKLSNEYDTTLNSNDILLRRFFYNSNSQTHNIGHHYFNKNVTQFLNLQRNVNHSIVECRYSRDYRTMFNFIN